MKNFIICTILFALILALFSVWDKQLAQQNAWEVSQEIAGHPHG